jgi:hypothetical protein
MGLSHTVLIHKVGIQGADPDRVNPQFDTLRNSASASDYQIIYRYLALGNRAGLPLNGYLSSKVSLPFLNQELLHQHYQDTWNREECFHDHVAVAHKVGETSTASSDAGYYAMPSDPNKVVVFAGLEGADRLSDFGNIGREVLVRTGGSQTCVNQLDLSRYSLHVGSPQTSAKGTALPALPFPTTP